MEKNHFFDKKKTMMQSFFEYENRAFDIFRRYVNQKYYDKIASCISEYVPVKKYEYDIIPKTVIYTVVIGDYDYLHEPLYDSSLYDFVVISDHYISMDKNSSWQYIPLNKYADIIPKGLSSVELNRWLKMNPDRLFPNYEVSIYIDGCVSVVTDMIPIVLDFYNSGKEFGIHLHAHRKRILTELNMLLRLKKIKKEDAEAAKKQINQYYEEGFDDTLDLLEATILIRKHNCYKCKDLMKAWWEAFIGGIKRDQISLPYVLWKKGYGMHNLYLLGDNEYANPRFYIDKHK